MNLLAQRKNRILVLVILAILQILAVTAIVPKPYNDYLFLALHVVYIGLGFLSLTFRQALVNFLCITLPAFLVLIPKLLANVEDSEQVWLTLRISFNLYVATLLVALPFFGGGFLARLVWLRFRKRS